MPVILFGRLVMSASRRDAMYEDLRRLLRGYDYFFTDGWGGSQRHEVHRIMAMYYGLRPDEVAQLARDVRRLAA